VTRGRRSVAFLCDVLALQVTGAAARIATQLFLEYVVQDHDAVLDGSSGALAGVLVPLALWLVVVLVTGQSIGDLAVELRYRGTRMPEMLARVLRWLGGVGGYLLLGLLPEPWSGLATLFALGAVVLVFVTKRGRGLPGILSAQHLTDARERQSE